MASFQNHDFPQGREYKSVEHEVKEAATPAAALAWRQLPRSSFPTSFLQ
jgi:hypothetical protein